MILKRIKLLTPLLLALISATLYSAPTRYAAPIRHEAKHAESTSHEENNPLHNTVNSAETDGNVIQFNIIGVSADDPAYYWLTASNPIAMDNISNVEAPKFFMAYDVNNSNAVGSNIIDWGGPTGYLAAQLNVTQSSFILHVHYSGNVPGHLDWLVERNFEVPFTYRNGQWTYETQNLPSTVTIEPSATCSSPFAANSINCFDIHAYGIIFEITYDPHSEHAKSVNTKMQQKNVKPEIVERARKA